MPRLPLAVLPALALTLVACGSEGADAPGAVSSDEARALEDAASMLDERGVPPDALPTDEPAAEMTGDAAPARP